MAISGVGIPTTSSILSAVYGVGSGTIGGGQQQQSGGTPLSPALFNSLLTGSTISATFGAASYVDNSGLFSALAGSYGVSTPFSPEPESSSLYDLLT